MGMEGWCRVACVSEFTGVCVCVCTYGGGGEPKSGLHKWSMCGCSAALRSIHVAAANGMTTSLLPITICLLCANLSQHIQVWPCPHLTLSKSTTQGRTGGRKGKKDKIRALTLTAALGANSERGQLEFIGGQRQEIYTGGFLVTQLAQVRTTYLHHPGFKSGPGPLSSVSSLCQPFTKQTDMPNTLSKINLKKWRQLHSQCGTDLKECFFNLVAKMTGAKTRFL